MKLKNTNNFNSKEILYNDHYVAKPYDCSSLTADSSGIIKAGTIVPANDKTAVGVLLYDVKKDENPNGVIVIHGFIKASALPAAPSADTSTEIGAKSALKQITFI